MFRRSSALPAVPAGQAIVLLTFEHGDVVIAELLTVLHPLSAPLRVPAERIATQAGLAVSELAGNRFTVATLTSNDADGFVLLNDPRT